MTALHPPNPHCDGLPDHLIRIAGVWRSICACMGPRAREALKTGTPFELELFTAREGEERDDEPL